MFAFNTYSVYILTNKPRGVLYTGFTNSLERRTAEHKQEVNDGFTKRYKIHRLVYYEQFDRPMDGIRREKAIKKWNRAWKIALIEKHNPTWIDLCQEDGTILPLPIE